jgi:hypothetical protein
MADMQQAIRAAFEPQWLDAMTRLGDRMRQQTESLQRAFASAVTPAFEQWSLQLPKISNEWVEQMRPAFEQMRPAFEQLRRSWEEALPPNWEGFDVEAVSAAIERIESPVVASSGCRGSRSFAKYSRPMRPPRRKSSWRGVATFLTMP